MNSIMIVNLFSIIAKFKIIEGATGYALGLSFYKFIQSFIESILVPLLDTFFDKDFSEVKLTIAGSQLLIGQFAESFIYFMVIVGCILFILRVLLVDIIDDILVHQDENLSNVQKPHPKKIQKQKVENMQPQKQERLRQEPPQNRQQEMPNQPQQNNQSQEDYSPEPQIRPMNQSSNVYSTINGGFNEEGSIMPYNS